MRHWQFSAKRRTPGDLFTDFHCFCLLLQNLCVDEKRGGEAATQPISWIGGGAGAGAGGGRIGFKASGRTRLSISPGTTSPYKGHPLQETVLEETGEISGTSREIGRNRSSGIRRGGSIDSIERRVRHTHRGETAASEFGGDTAKGAMREAFPSLPFGSPVLDREISKINSNNISSNAAGTAASSGTPRCHSTSPHPPPSRGPIEREGATAATTTTTTPSPLHLGTTILNTGGGGGSSSSTSVATSPVPSHHHLNIIKEGVQTLERDNFLSNISSDPAASTEGEWGVYISI